MNNCAHVNVDPVEREGSGNSDRENFCQNPHSAIRIPSQNIYNSTICNVRMILERIAAIRVPCMVRRSLFICRPHPPPPSYNDMLWVVMNELYFVNLEYHGLLKAIHCYPQISSAFKPQYVTVLNHQAVVKVQLPLVVGELVLILANSVYIPYCVEIILWHDDNLR